MLHYTVYHHFITENGKNILIDSSYSLRVAEAKAKSEDPSAKYIGIEIK